MKSSESEVNKVITPLPWVIFSGTVLIKKMPFASSFLIHP